MISFQSMLFFVFLLFFCVQHWVLFVPNAKMIIVWSYFAIFLVISCNSSTEMFRETDEHELFDFNFLSVILLELKV